MNFSEISVTDGVPSSALPMESIDLTKTNPNSGLPANEPVAIESLYSTSTNESSQVQIKSDDSFITSKAEEFPVTKEQLPLKQTVDNVRTLRSSSAELTSSPVSMVLDNDGAMDIKESPVHSVSPAVPLENTSGFSSKLPQRHAVVSPFCKNQSLNSPTRSLTPMSEKLEGVSPVELLETSDGSIRIKGDLDHSHISSVYTPSRSRSSSQSSKSSKGGSPKSHRSPSTKSKKKKPPPPKDDREHDKNDFYCWICHKEGEVLCCELCPRVMHAKCLHLTEEPEGDWYCPECEKIMVAECKETQSRAMSQLSIDQLALHLRYALQRMKTSGCEPFLEPVNTKEFPDYLDYVFHPMDINTLEKSIKKKTYGSTEAFLADVKWILHNCVIYNGPTTKLTHVAKVIVKIAQHEMNEIEVCPECYLNACRKRDNWFCEPCRDLHVLVWAKLQGFPHWPAKALRIEKGQVDVRFFGQHDRAWVPLANCYLMSKEMPLPVKNKKKGRGPGAKGGLDSAMQEAQMYIDNVTRKIGGFEYAPPRTPLTHLDLCQKPSSGQTTANTEESKITSQSGKDSLLIKREAIEEDEKKSSIDSAKSANRILNIKIGSAVTDVSLTPASVPPKKKSKVVTTSGGHPEKGYRPFAPQKKTPMLEKTIASLKVNIADQSDESSSDSDSSMDYGNDSTSPNSSSPDKAKKTEPSKSFQTKNKLAEESTDELVIDVKEDAEAYKKKDSSVTSLIEKGVVKVKKRSTESELKTIPKTKSILLNKDSEATRKSSPAPGPGVGTKRKFNDDSIPSTKIRKVEGSASVKSTSSVLKQSTKTSLSIKDKKYASDNEKSKKTREGTSPHSAPLPKKPISSELSAKKKISLSNAAKPRSEDGDKFALKSTAKLLSKKVMARKQTPVQEKPKSVHPIPSKPILPSSEFAAKKLSSFTIPKHKPSPVRNDSPDPSTVSKYNNHTSQASSNQQSRLPSVNVPMQKLKKYNDKMMQSVQHVLVEMYEDMLSMFKNSQGVFSSTNNADSSANIGSQQVSKLQLEIEQLKWSHQQQIAELQHNHDLTIAEIRQSLENEKLHVLEVAKRKSETEKMKAVEEAKKKQWCANCGKEAIFYCCWNTSYCDYPCQQLHWPKHMNTCSQAGNKDGSSAAVSASTSETPAIKSVADKPEVTASIFSSKVDEKPSVQVAEKSEPDKVIPTSAPDPEDPNNDDEHSDTDMMVIDETDAKLDLVSPDSPEPVSFPLKKPSANSEPVKSPVKTTIEKVQHLAATSTTTQAPIVGAVMTSLTSDKIKALLPRSSSSPTSNASTSSTKVVSSKLIDDLFSKVSKKETTKSDEAPESKESSSTDVKKPTLEGGDSDSSNQVTTQAAKTPSGGSTISAIGDRLLESKGKSFDSNDDPAESDKLTTEAIKSSNDVPTSVNPVSLTEQIAPLSQLSDQGIATFSGLSIDTKALSTEVASPEHSASPEKSVNEPTQSISAKTTIPDSLDHSASSSSTLPSSSISNVASTGMKSEIAFQSSDKTEAKSIDALVQMETSTSSSTNLTATKLSSPVGKEVSSLVEEDKKESVSMENDEKESLLSIEDETKVSLSVNDDEIMSPVENDVKESVSVDNDEKESLVIKDDTKGSVDDDEKESLVINDDTKGSVDDHEKESLVKEDDTKGSVDEIMSPVENDEEESFSVEDDTNVSVDDDKTMTPSVDHDIKTSVSVENDEKKSLPVESDQTFTEIDENNLVDTITIRSPIEMDVDDMEMTRSEPGDASSIDIDEGEAEMTPVSSIASQSTAPVVLSTSSNVTSDVEMTSVAPEKVEVSEMSMDTEDSSAH